MQWLHTTHSHVNLICPREPYKITRMQIHYDTFRPSDNSQTAEVLSPIMNCHNEYGLSQCAICKKELHKYLTTQSDCFDTPIDLHLRFPEPF